MAQPRGAEVYRTRKLQNSFRGVALNRLKDFANSVIVQHLKFFQWTNQLKKWPEQMVRGASRGEKNSSQSRHRTAHAISDSLHIGFFERQSRSRLRAAL